MPIVNDVERADRLSRLRGRVFNLLGTSLIVGDAMLCNLPGTGLANAVPWICVFLTGLLLIVSGGVWPGSLHGLLNDELARANRARALSAGYCATVACGCGLLILAAVVPAQIHAAQCLRILLTVTISAPLISFGAQEIMALKDGKRCV